MIYLLTDISLWNANQQVYTFEYSRTNSHRGYKGAGDAVTRKKETGTIEEEAFGCDKGIHTGGRQMERLN